MSDKKSLLGLRTQIKKRKPTYVRQDSHKKSKLSPAWRKPKGIQSKMRLHKRSYNSSPEIGYGSPKEVRGFSKSGLLIVNVTSLFDLDKYDPSKHELLILKVGKKKKAEIVKKAIERNFKINNLKNPREFIELLEGQLKSKKERKSQKLKEKEQKKKDLEKEAEEKKKKEKNKSIEETLSEEDKKKNQKKELDKTLTKKEQ